MEKLCRHKQRKDLQRSGNAEGHILCVDFRGNRGEVTEVVFAAVGDGFQVFRISAVGDADAGNLTLFCHIDCLLFFHNGIIGKLISGDSAALFYKSNNALCIGTGLRNLIQCLLYKLVNFVL